MKNIIVKEEIHAQLWELKNEMAKARISMGDYTDLSFSEVIEDLLNFKKEMSN